MPLLVHVCVILAEEISVTALAEGVLVVVLTGYGPGVVLAKELLITVLASSFLFTEPVEGVLRWFAYVEILQSRLT